MKTAILAGVVAMLVSAASATAAFVTKGTVATTSITKAIDVAATTARPAPGNRGLQSVPRLDIFVVNVDGSARRNLTRSPTWQDDSPALAPDGRTLAFIRHWREL